MGDSPDDEALARELHRELNVGPRRRQRRQAVPQNRANPPQKRARSAGSSSRDSTTNDDSDDFSDRLIPRPTPKPGQQRGSEPQDDGQVESSQKAIGPLQRSQTAPPPGTMNIKSDAGATTAPKPALAFPTPKTGKLSTAAIAPKSCNAGLMRKYSAPIQNRITPPKSPRHKKPKTSPPVLAKQSKDGYTNRPACQVGSSRQGAQLLSDATVPQMRSVPEMKATSSGKMPSGPRQIKLAPRASQSGTPAAHSLSQDNTSDDEPPPIHKVPKERRPHFHVAQRTDKPPSAPIGSLQGSQPGFGFGKSNVGDGHAAAPRRSSPKSVIDKLGKATLPKPHSKANEQKPPPDVFGQAATQGVKLKTSLEQGNSSMKYSAHQEPAAKLQEQKGAVYKAAASTQKAAGIASKATATPVKAAATVSTLTVPVEPAAIPSQQPIQVQHKGGTFAQRISATSQKASAPRALQQSEAPTSEARSTVRSWPDEYGVALPSLKVESFVKAASSERPRPDGTSAGSTPRVVEEQSKRQAGLTPQDLHNGRPKKSKSCTEEQQQDNKYCVQDRAVTAKQPADVNIKVEAENDAPPAALVSSNADAKNEAYDLMHLCPAHSELGSLLCQETGSAFCVWLRADEVSSRKQLGTALSTLYPGSMSAHARAANLEGSVPWQEATAQATHMLLKV